MSGFDDRKKGQEGKFAHDQEMEFKVMVRRNKLNPDISVSSP
ncbi:unnamed protein product [Discosporangium mesarthrocarpum]